MIGVLRMNKIIIINYNYFIKISDIPLRVIIDINFAFHLAKVQHRGVISFTNRPSFMGIDIIFKKFTESAYIYRNLSALPVALRDVSFLLFSVPCVTSDRPSRRKELWLKNVNHQLTPLFDKCLNPSLLHLGRRSAH